jgi:V/A-type H+/Na+-transporting ATPase subunit K
MKWNARGWGFVAAAAALCIVPAALAADAPEAAGGWLPASAVKTIGLGLAAALTMGLSVLGAGYAVGRIGSAAIGAAAEKPELMTRSLLFVALAEGLAVLGFAMAMLLLQRI